MSKSKSKINPLKRFLRLLGPGLVTGASDDDPSGIATYSQAGAMFGFFTLWTALITFPLMASIQETCARIGIVTSQGIMANIKKNYPPALMYFLMIFFFPALILNIAADLAGMGAVANLLIPYLPPYIYSIVFTIIIVLFIIFFQYKKVANVLKYLCLTLLLYLIVPFITNTDWPGVFKSTLIPHIVFDKEYLGILVAILGTTISPYLFFWQATMEAEEVSHKAIRKPNKNMMTKLRIDVIFGMLLSNIVMFFIILTAASVLNKNGITQITTVEQAAKALEPIAGKFSYLLFSIGVIGTGLLAIPVLCSSLSYILSVAFSWRSGLDKKYWQAKQFYWVIIISMILGVAINLFKISPIKMLILTAILYGLIAPIVIFIILLMANNKRIMGKYTSSLLSNIINILTLLLMSISSVFLIYLQLFG